jgi:hypothetical protein
MDVDLSPGPGSDAVSSTEPGRQGALVPLGTGAHRSQVGRELEPVAKGALEGTADTAGTSLCVLHP